MFGLADVSHMIFMRNMMQNAVREGVRYGITYQLNVDSAGCTSQTQCIKQVVAMNSLGFFSGTVGGQTATNYIKVSYYTPDTLSSPVTKGQLPKTVNGVNIQYMNQPGNLLGSSHRQLSGQLDGSTPQQLPGWHGPGFLGVIDGHSPGLTGRPAGAADALGVGGN